MTVSLEEKGQIFQPRNGMLMISYFRCQLFGMSGSRLKQDGST